MLQRLRALGGNRTAVQVIRVAVLLSSVLLMLPGTWGHSVTVVEFAHLPAGLAAWQRGSLGIYRVCGPVTKLLYALPAYLAGVRVDYPESFGGDTQWRREWMVGGMFQEQNCQRYHNIYRWSRLVPIVVTVLGGVLICEWATLLFGIWPGVASLCVWCWLPPVLGHGSLLTSDIASAVMIVLAARTFWSFIIKPGWARAVAAGLVLGAAAATKLTLLILYPCWTVLLIARVIEVGAGRAKGRSGWRSAARLASFGAVVLVASVIMLNALYLFRDMGCRLSQLGSGQSSLAREVRRLREHSATTWLLRVPLPIPRELLRGLDFQLADTDLLQTAYLLGGTRQGGSWYWYPAAAALKLPMAVVLLFGLALANLPGVLGGDHERLWGLICLSLPAAEAALVVGATTGTGSNAAFRYLLPSVALACVFVGGVARVSSGRKLVPVLLAWMGIATVAAVPDHLGWQNELGWIWERYSGCPALTGDSLDWGQDLARLAGWVAQLGQWEYSSLCLRSGRCEAVRSDRPSCRR